MTLEPGTLVYDRISKCLLLLYKRFYQETKGDIELPAWRMLDLNTNRIVWDWEDYLEDVATYEEV